MINDYKQAAVIDSAGAQDLVLGNKELYPVLDCHTIQFGTRDRQILS